MDHLQRNGGTAGFFAALCLALLFILFASSGLDTQTMLDPGKALPALGQKAPTFGAIGIVGFLAGLFGILFTIGVWVRLREKTPSRAVATLGFAFIGLTAHTVGSGLLWQGGAALAGLYAKDQTAASHAWVALGAVNQGLMATGNAFTGAAVLVAGWAIIASGVMNTALGWIAVVAGIVQILEVFRSSMALFSIGLLLVIIWLAWGGAELRRAAA